jgi:hypothetical protein
MTEPEKGPDAMPDPTDYYTPEARLLGNGWEPGEDMTRLIRQREALRAALGRLSPQVRDEGAIRDAIEHADAEVLAAAMTAQALAQWCDRELQSGFESEVALWDGYLRNALSALIARDPQAVLASLDRTEDPEGDAGAIRDEIAGYIEEALRVRGPGGSSVAAQPLRRAGSLIPRHVGPLASRRAHMVGSVRIGGY